MQNGGIFFSFTYSMITIIFDILILLGILIIAFKYTDADKTQLGDMLFTILAVGIIYGVTSIYWIFGYPIAFIVEVYLIKDRHKVSYGVSGIISVLTLVIFAIVNLYLVLYLMSLLSF